MQASSSFVLVMKIHVGSMNDNKVGAVVDICAEYPCWVGAEVVGMDVASGVGEQPIGIAATILGATNRARACKGDADVGVGIEAGLIEAPGMLGEKMNVQVCAIDDGTHVYHGVSAGFGLPFAVLEIIEKEHVQLDVAAHRAGITHDPRIGKAKGLIHLFSKGRIDRRELVRQALRMAMIHIEK